MNITQGPPKPASQANFDSWVLNLDMTQMETVWCHLFSPSALDYTISIFSRRGQGPPRILLHPVSYKSQSVGPGQHPRATPLAEMLVNIHLLVKITD